MTGDDWETGHFSPTNYLAKLHFYRHKIKRGDTFWIVQSPKKNFFIIPRATSKNHQKWEDAKHNNKITSGNIIWGDEFIKKEWLNISRLFWYGEEFYIDPKREG